MASFEAVVKQDNADFPLDMLPIFESRPITRFRFQQVPKGEVQTTTMRRCSTLQKNYLSFLIYKDRSGERMLE